MNNEFKDYYRILGVTPDASQRSIEVARDRELSQYWNSVDGRLNIQEAYYVLSNPDLRKSYDERYNQVVSEGERARLNAKTYEDLINVQTAYPSFEVETPEVIEEKKEEMSSSGEGTSEVPVEAEEKKEEMSSSGEGTSEVPVEAEEKKEEMSSSGEGTSEVPVEAEEKKEEMSSPGEGTSEVPVEVEEKKEEKDEEISEEIVAIPIDKQQQNIKTPSKSSDTKRKVAVGAGIVLTGAFLGPAGLVFGLPVAIVTNKLITKLSKSKLTKDKKPKKMTDIQIQETKLIEEYNKRLEEQIYDLLSKSHSDYELEIAKLKYRNQVELLEERIKMKKAESVKKGGVTKFKLELFALENKLKLAKKTLSNLEAKVVEHNKDSKLNKANEALYKKRDEHQAQEEKAKTDSKVNEIGKVKKLQIQFNSLKKKRDNLAHKMVLKKDGISRKQTFLVAFDAMKNKVTGAFDRFSDVESEVSVDEMEEEVKTR